MIHKKHHVKRHDKEKDVCENSLRNHEDSYYKCDFKRHWSRVCRAPELFYKFYKASLKEKGKEVNFTKHHDPMDDSTHLDVSDFTDDFTDHSIHCDSIDTGDNYIYECIIIILILMFVKLSSNIIFHL